MPMNAQGPGKQLDQLIAEFLQAVEEGRSIDRDALLGGHPEMARELQQFFDNHDRIRKTLPADVAGPALALENYLLAPETDRDALTKSDTAPFSMIGGSSILPAGQQFGDYDLLDEVARGGMGIVFRARQRRLNRIVALKMILSGPLATDSDVQRFYQEAESAAQLDHSGIVPIHEVGQCGGLHYYTMSFIEGRSLSEILQEGPLEPAHAAQLVRKVASAVAYAHQHQVIHRDLKPANILIDAHGEPRITDFGLAKRLDAGQELTTSGQILGTLQYMSPEQATGRIREVDASTDVYSLGAVLYAALTGRPPFQAANHVDLLLSVLESEPVPPRRENPRIPRELERICLRCLEKDPRRRYRSAEELAHDLDLFLRGEPLQVATSRVTDAVRRWPRRYPALAAHWAALGFLELFRQAKILFVSAEGFDYRYHFQFTAIIAGLAVVCALFQWMLTRQRWSTAVRFLWAAADVAFLTWALLLARGPLGLLLPVFALLIVGSVSFFRVRLVSFMTVCCLAAYGLVLWVRPQEAQPPHYVFVCGAALALIGLILGLHVRRMRQLSQYYEE
jgi:eukaryotic-like serine/threonine-protein kinase